MSETTDYSRSWTASSDPSKQRKRRRNAPHHQRKQFLNAHLADAVQERMGTRSVPVRTGDKVEVMRGDYSGEKGRVDDIDTEEEKIYINGVEREAVDGSETAVPVDPSNLKITKLDLDDPERLADYDVSEEEKEEISVEPAEDEEPDEAAGEEDEDGEDEVDAEEEAGTDETADPEDIVAGTVDEVKEAVESGANPAAVLEAEQANKDRVTLVDWLENRVDGDTDE
ncbi:MAG: 50S ribosomal protein L24 [Candidatus Nanohaloarchaea archaeon]|nr:50S ribosomal protein L24 [Candidatus Nanohaloarchaea archaeon]